MTHKHRVALVIGGALVLAKIGERLYTTGFEWGQMVGRTNQIDADLKASARQSIVFIPQFFDRYHCNNCGESILNHDDKTWRCKAKPLAHAPVRVTTRTARETALMT